MNKKKAYIYPITARLKTGLDNPYLNDFMDSLSHSIEFTNRNKPSNSGIFNIVKFINNLDYIFLNWIEDLPDKKGGSLQIIFLRFLFRYCHLKKIKIVWTVHNKLSHYHQNKEKKTTVINLLSRHCDYIITHASEGEKYALELNPNIEIFKTQHPLKLFSKLSKTNVKYDILIWGTVAPYKGIDKFLDFIYKQNLELKYKILIAGKILSEDYQKKMEYYGNEKIQIINDFLDFDTIRELISSSKVILFTYQSESILSSGALMDTIACYGNVLGPSIGAFNDLASENIINTYNSFEEIPLLIDQVLSNNINKNDDLRDSFIKENSWENFGNNLTQWLKDN